MRRKNRLSGCVRDKNEVDLNETTTVRAESMNIESVIMATFFDNIPTFPCELSD